MFGRHGNHPQDIGRAITNRAPHNASGRVRSDFVARLLVAVVRIVHPIRSAGPSDS